MLDMQDDTHLSDQHTPQGPSMTDVFEPPKRGLVPGETLNFSDSDWSECGGDDIPGLEICAENVAVMSGRGLDHPTCTHRAVFSLNEDNESGRRGVDLVESSTVTSDKQCIVTNVSAVFPEKGLHAVFCRNYNTGNSFLRALAGLLPVDPAAAEQSPDAMQTHGAGSCSTLMDKLRRVHSDRVTHGSVTANGIPTSSAVIRDRIAFISVCTFHVKSQNRLSFVDGLEKRADVYAANQSIRFPVAGYVNPDATVLENLQMALSLRLRNVTGTVTTQIIYRTAAQTHISRFLTDPQLKELRVDVLRQSDRYLLGVAMELITDPAVLILAFPFGVCCHNVRKGSDGSMADGDDLSNPLQSSYYDCDSESLSSTSSTTTPLLSPAEQVDIITVLVDIARTKSVIVSFGDNGTEIPQCCWPHVRRLVVLSDTCGHMIYSGPLKYFFRFSAFINNFLPILRIDTQKNHSGRASTLTGDVASIGDVLGYWEAKGMATKVAEIFLHEYYHRHVETGPKNECASVSRDDFFVNDALIFLRKAIQHHKHRRSTGVSQGEATTDSEMRSTTSPSPFYITRRNGAAPGPFLRNMRLWWHTVKYTLIVSPTAATRARGFSLISWFFLFICYVVCVSLGERQSEDQMGMQNIRGIVFFILACVVLVNILLIEGEVRSVRTQRHYVDNNYFTTIELFFATLLRLALPRAVFLLLSFATTAILFERNSGLIALLAGMTSFAHSLLVVLGVHLAPLFLTHTLSSSFSTTVSDFRSKEVPQSPVEGTGPKSKPQVGTVYCATTSVAGGSERDADEGTVVRTLTYLHLMYFMYALSTSGFLLNIQSMPRFVSSLSILRPAYGAAVFATLHNRPYECETARDLARNVSYTAYCYTGDHYLKLQGFASDSPQGGVIALTVTSSVIAALVFLAMLLL